MRAIYKYKLERLVTQTVPIPKSARILTVQMQDGYFTLWAEIDDVNDLPVLRTIEIIATGQEFEAARREYVGTVQDGNGGVWHVYENRDV